MIKAGCINISKTAKVYNEWLYILDTFYKRTFR
nr:MAG TPA: hypothetical protein [Caudoviricetes sp.]